MSGPGSIDPNHESTRDVLRLVGPVVAIIGGIFMLVGLIDFFSAFGSFGSNTTTFGDQTVTFTPGIHTGPPQRFWCLFVGLPILGIGLALCRAGFMGTIARYKAGEIAPVVTDSINYAARESQDTIREVAQAIGQGLRGTAPANPAHAPCPRCSHANDPDARFCSSCGSPLAATRPCPDCCHENNAQSRFCDNCGHPLTRD